jgi:alpha-tubulin suppressor-like RCC1 family protein
MEPMGHVSIRRLHRRLLVAALIIGAVFVSLSATAPALEKRTPAGAAVKLTSPVVPSSWSLAAPSAAASPRSAGAGPVITRISRASGAAGDRLTIRGRRFGARRAGGRVLFGSVRATRYLGWSARKIVCRVPAMPGGKWTLRVRAAGRLSNGKRFTIAIPPTPGGWAAISAGTECSLALREDGALWSWGLNDYGQLGLGDTLDRTTPTQVGDAHDWAAVSCGALHSSALKRDGSLWTWGRNDYGQLGLGDKMTRMRPTRVGGDTDWTFVSSRGTSSLALKSDGSLWGWGPNIEGHLGLGDTDPRTTPTRVGSDSDWASVCCGAMDSFAIKTNGSLWGWGLNWTGELGVGDTERRLTPTRVDTDNDWIAVSHRFNFALALKRDGSIWTWGSNRNGQLGLGDWVTRSMPSRVGDDYDWVSISGMDVVGTAIKSDGSLWAWGSSLDGCLGLGEGYGDWPSPTRVGSSTAWKAVSVDYGHTLGVMSDGSLWAWGRNDHGQRGLGTKDDGRRAPTLVGPK